MTAKGNSFRKVYIVDKDFISNPIIDYLEGEVKGTRFFPLDTRNRPRYYSASLWFDAIEEAQERALALKHKAIEQAERRLVKLKNLTWSVSTD